MRDYMPLTAFSSGSGTAGNIENQGRSQKEKAKHCLDGIYIFQF